MSALIKNILVIGGLILIAGVGYYLYTQRTGLAVDRTNNTTVTNQAAAETEVFLRRLNDLKQIELNRELFTDRRFLTLQEYATDVPAESIGRSNPFQLNQ